MLLNWTAFPLHPRPAANIAKRSAIAIPAKVSGATYWKDDRVYTLEGSQNPLRQHDLFIRGESY